MVTFRTFGPIGSIDRRSVVVGKVRRCNNLKWWAHQDSNLGPADYESKGSRCSRKHSVVEFHPDPGIAAPSEQSAEPLGISLREGRLTLGPEEGAVALDDRQLGGDDGGCRVQGPIDLGRSGLSEDQREQRRAFEVNRAHPAVSPRS